MMRASVLTRTCAWAHQLHHGTTRVLADMRPLALGHLVHLHNLLLSNNGLPLPLATAGATPRDRHRYTCFFFFFSVLFFLCHSALKRVTNMSDTAPLPPPPSPDLTSMPYMVLKRALVERGVAGAAAASSKQELLKIIAESNVDVAAIAAAADQQRQQEAESKAKLLKVSDTRLLSHDT